MTTSPGWVHGRITELDRAECLELLMRRSVGRVGFGTADGPLVLPVNFVPYDGGVLFRTSPHNSIAQNLNGRPACFEVDEIDDFTESGWSVLVRGTAAFVDDAAHPAPRRTSRAVGRGHPVAVRPRARHLGHRSPAVPGLTHLRVRRTGGPLVPGQSSPSRRPVSSSTVTRSTASRSPASHGRGDHCARDAIQVAGVDDPAQRADGQHAPALVPVVVDVVHLEGDERPPSAPPSAGPGPRDRRARSPRPCAAPPRHRPSRSSRGGSAGRRPRRSRPGPPRWRPAASGTRPRSAGSARARRSPGSRRSELRGVGVVEGELLGVSDLDRDDGHRAPRVVQHLAAGRQPGQARDVVPAGVPAQHDDPGVPGSTQDPPPRHRAPAPGTPAPRGGTVVPTGPSPRSAGPLLPWPSGPAPRTPQA